MENRAGTAVFPAVVAAITTCRMKAAEMSGRRYAMFSAETGSMRAATIGRRRTTEYECVPNESGFGCLGVAA